LASGILIEQCVYEAVRSIDDIDHEAVRQRNGFARVLPGAVGSHHRKIQLAVLVDRGSRELPIQPDYTGIRYSAVTEEEEVSVRLREMDGQDAVLLSKTL